MKKSLVKTTVAVGVAAALAGMSHTASAAGFALIEMSANGMGNAFAGGAAKAEDLSTIWFNPAGMTRFEGRHLALAGHVVQTSTQFNDGGSPPPLNGGDGGDPGTTSGIPNLYWLQRVNDGNTVFGIAINVPFGLNTEYEDGWIGRYHATKSEITAVNINPALAWKFGKIFSLGVGASIQYVEAEIGNKLDSFGICFQFTGDQATCAAELGGPANAASDSEAKVEGSDYGMGFNIGVLVEPSERTRFGVHYRSKIRQKLEGDADFTLNQDLLNATVPVPEAGGAPVGFVAAGAFSDQGARATVDLPDTASISAYHQFGNGIAIMGDITWTGWSSFDELRVKFDGGDLPDSVTTEDWDDSFRYAVGLDVPAGQKVMLRFGLAFDETPIPSAERRTPRIPGEDRTWYAFGLGWQINKRSSLDFGAAYLQVDDAEINNTKEDGSDYTLVGDYTDADVLIGSIQYNRSFALF